MKFSLRAVLLLLTSTVLFTSCFEIKEIVHFNKDGSGNFEFVMDMSGMGAMMSMLEGLQQEMGAEEEVEDGEEGEEAEGEGNMMDGLSEGLLGSTSGGMMENVEALKTISGLTNVETIDNKDEMKYGLKFSFADVDALNKGLSTMFKDESGNSKDMVFFKMKKKKIERIDVTGLKEKLAEQMNSEEMDMGDMGDMPFDVSALLGDVKYTTIYSFDRKVKKSANKEARTMDDGKKVVIEQKIFDKDSKTKIDNVVKLK